jgi:hypothetical protein
MKNAAIQVEKTFGFEKYLQNIYIYLPSKALAILEHGTSQIKKK